MVKESLKVAIYELQHFMQWGTPEDLKEYLKWSPLKSLEDMCCDEWRWRKLNPKGF